MAGTPVNGTPPRQCSKERLSGYAFDDHRVLTIDCAIGTPDTGSSPLVNPSSALLQDLLKEQRAYRGSRGPPSEGGNESAPRTPERPQPQEESGSEKMRKVSNTLSAGLKQPREMGMREMDQVGYTKRDLCLQKLTLSKYISKINKQNFDLKLEVFHRTQQMTVLVKKLERMQELEDELKRMRGLEDEVQELRNAEEDNQRLRESNDELRNELDKRDQAVTEAVELICQLEAKVEELGGGANSSRPSTARPLSIDGSDVVTPKIAAIDIPERTSSKRASTTSHLPNQKRSNSRNLERAPSFLREEKKSTAALRALFTPNEMPSNSAMSVVTKTESSHSMNNVTEAESPRISALSECSELDPYESPSRPNGLDQLDIPIRKTSSPETSHASGQDKGAEERKNDIINKWMDPQEDISPLKLPKRGRTMDVFTKATTPSVESDLLLNGKSPRVQSEAMFGGLRLHPTPDTLYTPHATATNRSNGSISVEKAPSEEVLRKRAIVRPHSADALKPRLNAFSNAMTDSMDANASGATPLRLKYDGLDDTPAIFPLHGLPSNSRNVFSPGLSNIPTFGFYGGASMFDGNKEGATFGTNKEYSPSSKSTSTELSDSSSSPTLAPYDWIEAAKTGSRGDMRHGPTPINFGTVGASRSSLWGRRHSVDSSLREPEAPVIPTLDMDSLEPQPQALPVRESRRRISFRPPFFSRSIIGPRRHQPSPICDVVDPNDDDDGAPSPVIRKTRQTDKRQSKLDPDRERAVSSYDDTCRSPPMHSDTNGDYHHRTLPHSFTDANISAHGSVQRPLTANGKEHKRRGSLSIFGWMKGASGLGSNKKSEPNSPTLTNRPSSRMTMMKEKTPTRFAPESPDLNNRSPTPAYPDSPDTKHAAKMDDQDAKRRPRYMERERRTRRP